MDIAGTAWGPKEPAYQPKIGATGVAVRLVYQFLENRFMNSRFENSKNQIPVVNQRFFCHKIFRFV